MQHVLQPAIKHRIPVALHDLRDHILMTSHIIHTGLIIIQDLDTMLYTGVHSFLNKPAELHVL